MSNGAVGQFPEAYTLRPRDIEGVEVDTEDVRPSSVCRQSEGLNDDDALGAWEDKRSHLNAASAITINNRRQRPAAAVEEEATVTCHGRNAK